MTTVAVPGLVPGLQAPCAPGVLQRAEPCRVFTERGSRRGPGVRALPAWAPGGRLCEAGLGNLAARWAAWCGGHRRCRRCWGEGGAAASTHTHTPRLPGLPRSGLCPVLRGPGGDLAPTCGHHQPGSQRLLCRRGVWGSKFLKPGFRVALIIRHLSHGWRGGDGGGPWHGGLLLCTPRWVSVTQAARARPQGPSVALTTWLRAAEGLPQCPGWGPVPLPGMEQRGFRELETRAQRTGPHLGSTCLSPAKLWF